MIAYQKLTKKELDTFIQMRIRQLREEGATEDIDLVPALQDYYNRHMSDGTFVSWLALDGDRIIGTSGMSFVEKPPYFGCPSGRIGLLSSMFTNPDYRRKGIAKELLHRVVEEARATFMPFAFRCSRSSLAPSFTGSPSVCIISLNRFMHSMCSCSMLTLSP